MKYFLHDSQAFQDEKITELFMQFGYEGIGLFFTILEKLAFNESPVKTKVLKEQLKIGKKLEKCWNFLEEIGLISSLNDETFNKNILKYSEKYLTKKENTRKRVENFRKNQELTNNVTCYNDVTPALCNTDVTLPNYKISNNTTKNYPKSDFVFNENKFNENRKEAQDIANMGSCLYFKCSDDPLFAIYELGGLINSLIEKCYDYDVFSRIEIFHKLFNPDFTSQITVRSLVNDYIWKFAVNKNLSDENDIQEFVNNLNEKYYDTTYI